MARTIMAVAALLTAAGAGAADPIEGNWKTQAGATAAIESCGSGFCIILRTAPYAGKLIGTFGVSGTEYAGRITDPTKDKTYSGRATLSGDTLRMSGCVLFGLICRSETWKRM